MNKFPLMRNNITRQDLDAVIAYLRKEDPILTNGPMCAEFEQKWSRWLGVKYSVFVSSGSAANLLSMAVLRNKFPQGGEIIVPPLTWVSDVASVIQNGFVPVFCDINPRTLGMDCDQVLSAINERTRAVFYTHVQGFNGFSDDFLQALKEKNVILIEDVCESHGATHRGKKLGTFGLMSNFSFYYAHHMSTIEGGMVCTDDYEIYQELRMLRSHGMLREVDDEAIKNYHKNVHLDLNPDFIFMHAGYNLRNNEIGAIIGLSQLDRLDSMVRRRVDNHNYFLSLIDKSVFRTDFEVEGSSNYAFNLILNKADDDLFHRLQIGLRALGVEFRRGSAGGGNQLRQPYLKRYFGDTDLPFLPCTDHVHFYGMYLGNFPNLSRKEILTICNYINELVQS